MSDLLMNRNILNIAATLAIAIVSMGLQNCSKQNDSSTNTTNSTYTYQEKLEPLTFLSVEKNKIINEKGDEIKLRGFHYDCFYMLTKEIYDASKLSNGEPDQINIELSKYYFTENDIEEIKNIGANVVRVELRLWQIEKTPYLYSEESLKHLDDTITKLGRNGIYVILDLHAAGQNFLSHNREYGNILWDDNDFQNRIVALWAIIVNRYKDNPYIAGYDIINEPQAPTKNALYSFYQKIIQEIRRVDKKHILFIEWNFYNTEEILFGGEYDDPNIVLSVHFYKPVTFTFQGLQNNPVGYRYPGTYGDVYWDKEQISKYFTKILAINELKEKPLYVGEFSAAVWSGGEDALQWIDDVIEVFNSKGIHYSFFHYKSGYRPAHSLYMPTEDVQQQINVLIDRIFKGELKLNDLKENDKRLFLTENFESSGELRQLLRREIWQY